MSDALSESVCQELIRRADVEAQREGVRERVFSPHPSGRNVVSFLILLLVPSQFLLCVCFFFFFWWFPLNPVEVKLVAGDQFGQPSSKESRAGRWAGHPGFWISAPLELFFGG